MNYKHTPGPWTVDPKAEKRGVLRITANNGITEVATVNESVFVCAENASLIAAAPDMLATLRNLNSDDDCDDVAEVRDAIENAIENAIAAEEGHAP